LTFAGIPFYGESSFGFGIWDIILTFCGCSLALPIPFSILLGELRDNLISILVCVNRFYSRLTLKFVIKLVLKSLVLRIGIFLITAVLL